MTRLMETKFISIFKSVDFARRKIPLIIQKSPNPGPVIWVTAAIHGDEVTGIETVLRLNRFLKRNPLLKGTVYSLPIMNPSGYELISRNEPIGKMDLNRCFPGSPVGNMAERIAFKIFSEIVETKPVLAIDLHTDTMESIPYVYLDQIENPKNSWIAEKILEYAKISGINYFVENWGTYEELKNSISAALINIGNIPAFTLELGGPFLIKEKFVMIGLEIIKNLLFYLGMINLGGLTWVYSHKVPLEGIWETTLHRYYANYSGIVEYKVQPGDIVKKGQALARVKNLFSKTLEIIKTKEELMVVSCADQSVCFPGTELLMTAKRNDKAFRGIFPSL